MIKKNLSVSGSSSPPSSPRYHSDSTVADQIDRFRILIWIAPKLKILTDECKSQHEHFVEKIFPQIQSLPLIDQFIQQISNFLCAPNAPDIAPEILPKVFEILVKNILQTLQDPELPEPIKSLTIQTMPEMTRILDRMFSGRSGPLLLNSEGNTSFSEYTETALSLKRSLIADKDPAGITFSGRSIKLFAWCREEIAETANPLVGYLMDKIAPIVPEFETIYKQFHELFNILNLLILQIACGDDVADNIQEPTLTDTFADIPKSREDGRIDSHIQTVSETRGGLFLPFFNLTVKLWDDAIAQLERLFEKEYFNQHVKQGFLAIHSQVMESLTFSQHMNSEPKSVDITQATILEKLAPNMMVECFRFLEKSLVQKVASTHHIELPRDTDLAIVGKIISKSQKTASAANAAATAPRELKENDLSSPFPFEMNRLYDSAMRHGKSFVDAFEAFLVEKKYNNHFFATYGDCDLSQFDYLDLLVIRRFAYEKIVGELDALKRRGVTIAEDNYSNGTLALSAKEAAISSPTSHIQMSGRFLEKLIRHVNLIDAFSSKLAEETNVQNQFFKSWQDDIQSMKDDAAGLTDPDLKRQTIKYVESWEVFLCMYLIFKRSFDGTI